MPNIDSSGFAKGHRIAVFGASGHTGRFVVSELRRRGSTAILVGRDRERLELLQQLHPSFEIRVVSMGDAASLDQALCGASAVINCAGPFLDTASAVIEAALRAGMHYLDVTAEQPVALATFERYSGRASAAGILIVPSVAFFGGLGDLLATAAMDGWRSADEIRIGIAMDSWYPTQGTRLTGKRNTTRRLVVSEGKLTFVPDPPPKTAWSFPEPFGTQDVIALPLAEIVTISHHLQASEISTYMNLAPLADLHNPETPAPVSADGSGRSSQRFLMHVIVRKGEEVRHAVASGRDIYAITAPLVVEAAERILTQGTERSGAVASGEIMDAHDFLRTLSQVDLSFELHTSA
jgi:hypothetical protein